MEPANINELATNVSLDMAQKLEVAQMFCVARQGAGTAITKSIVPILKKDLQDDVRQSESVVANELRQWYEAFLASYTGADSDRRNFHYEIRILIL